MLKIIQCNPKRDEWPEIKSFAFKTDGRRNGTEWLCSVGHSKVLHDDMGVALNDTDDILYVSPNMLVELLPDEIYPFLGLTKPTKKTHPALTSSMLPAG